MHQGGGQNHGFTARAGGLHAGDSILEFNVNPINDVEDSFSYLPSIYGMRTKGDPSLEVA